MGVRRIVGLRPVKGRETQVRFLPAFILVASLIWRYSYNGSTPVNSPEVEGSSPPGGTNHGPPISGPPLFDAPLHQQFSGRTSGFDPEGEGSIPPGVRFS